MPRRDGRSLDGGDREDTVDAGCTSVDGRTRWGSTVGTVVGGRETFECNGTPGAPLDKTCARAEDCFAAFHRYDACGSMGLVGLDVRDRERFEDAEAACRWPPNSCPAAPWIAEDGSIEWASPLRVLCCGGLCRTTYVPPGGGRRAPRADGVTSP